MRLWAALVAASAVAVVAGRPAGARPAASASAASAAESPLLTLVKQPAWTRLGGRLPIKLNIAGARPGLHLRLTLYGRLSSRTAFERTTTGEGLGSAVARIDLPLDEHAVSADGDYLAQIGLTDRGGSSGDRRLPVTRTGVYPMRAEVVDNESGEALSGLVTWIVAVEDAPIDAPLSISWIWRISAPPLARADGSHEPAVLAQMQPRGRLDRIATLMHAANGVPLTLALSPETLESWRAAARDDPSLSDGYATLAAAAARDEHQLLPEPYVPIEIPSIEAAGLGDELVPELVAGTDTLERLLHRRVDPRTAFVDPVDAAAIDRLRESFVDRVAVPDEYLVPTERNLTPARPFSLATGTRTVNATSTNPGLYGLLEGELSGGLLAQRFLAGVSLVALEAPSLQRGLVFATPPDWNPETDVVRLVLEGLHDNPLLKPRTLDGYFAAVPVDTFDDSGEPLVRLLASSRPSAFPVTASQLADARLTLESFRSVVGADDTRIRHGERALLLALTSSWNAERSSAELAATGRAAQAFLSGITLTDQSVTVTSRRSNIPLSFVNSTGRPVRVRVRLASSKLLFPDGPERIIDLAEGNTTERFFVEARANGTFSMSVTITSEDGRLPAGPPSSVAVRARVLSGVGALLTLGALLFLAGWWANHAWRARRDRRSSARPAGPVTAP